MTKMDPLTLLEHCNWADGTPRQRGGPTEGPSSLAVIGWLGKSGSLAL